jgi:phage-related holin
MITVSTLVALLVWLIVIGCIFGLLTWLVQVIPLPEPFAKIARVVLAVVAVLIVISLLLNLVGYPVLR